MAKVKNKSPDGGAGKIKKKRRRGRDLLQRAMGNLSLSREPKIPAEHTQAEAQQSVNQSRRDRNSLTFRKLNLPEDWRQSAFNPKAFQGMIRAITEAIHPDIEFEYPALITLRDEVENIVVQVMQKAAQAAELANRSEIRVEDMKDDRNLAKTKDETMFDIPESTQKSNDGDTLFAQASVKQAEVRSLDALPSVECEMSM